MTATTGLEKLASLLEALGLRINSTPGADLVIVNPVAASLVDAVLCVSGGYLIGCGYEIGQVGDEPSTAQRLAFLLGVPGTQSTTTYAAVAATPRRPWTVAETPLPGALIGCTRRSDP